MVTSVIVLRFSVYLRMFMHIFYVLAVLVAQSSGTAPGPPAVEGQHKPNSDLLRREATAGKVMLDHPTWESRAEGLEPVSQEQMRVKVGRIRNEFGKALHKWERFSPEHTAFLKDIFAQDPLQGTARVYEKFELVFGRKAVPKYRIARWWHNARRHFKERAQKKTVALGIPSTPSEDTEIDLDMSWLDLSGLEDTELSVADSDDPEPTETDNQEDISDFLSQLPSELMDLDGICDPSYGNHFSVSPAQSASAQIVADPVVDDVNEAPTYTSLTDVVGTYEPELPTDWWNLDDLDELLASEQDLVSGNTAVVDPKTNVQESEALWPPHGWTFNDLFTFGDEDIDAVLQPASEPIQSGSELTESVTAAETESLPPLVDTSIASPVVNTLNESPEEAGGPESANPGDFRRHLEERDAIVRSLLIRHPAWNSVHIFNAARPLIEAAGLPPWAFPSLQQRLVRFRKEMGTARVRDLIPPSQLVVLRSGLAANAGVTAPELGTELQSWFGPEAVSVDRIDRWLISARRPVRYVRNDDGTQVLLKNPAAAAPVPQAGRPSRGGSKTTPASPSISAAQSRFLARVAADARASWSFKITEEQKGFIQGVYAHRKQRWAFRDVYAALEKEFGSEAAPRELVKAAWKCRDEVARIGPEGTDGRSQSSTGAIDRSPRPRRACAEKAATRSASTVVDKLCPTTLEKANKKPIVGAFPKERSVWTTRHLAIAIELDGDSGRGGLPSLAELHDACSSRFAKEGLVPIPLNTFRYVMRDVRSPGSGSGV